jgi:UTP--glucose-1-phosphate uridylyltransferase
MTRIKKVIIPVAGYGTRFLPVTKAQPKEMLPVVDKPVLQYIVENAVAAGIEDVIIVTNFNKRAVEDHFDRLPELESWLQRQGKSEALAQIKNVAELANFIYIRQKGPYGNGTPILNAKHLINDEPFAVLFGDDLVISDIPHPKQLIETYETYGDPVLGAIQVDDQGTHSYGILETDPVAEKIFKVKAILEKPGPTATASRLAATCGYILTPDIFEALESTPTGKGGELWLVDAIAKLKQKRSIYARQIDGQYYDMGSKLRWLEANVIFGLKHPELKDDFRRFLKSVI